MNRLRSRTNKAMSLFVPNAQSVTVPSFNPFHKPESEPKQEATSEPASATAEKNNDATIDNLIDSADAKIKLSHAHNNALEVLNSAIDQLKNKMDDVKADKLPSVITAAAKVVDGIRRERNEASKNAASKAVHLHFYTPVQRKISEYEVIDVG